MANTATSYGTSQRLVVMIDGQASPTLSLQTGTPRTMEVSVRTTMGASATLSRVQVQPQIAGLQVQLQSGMPSARLVWNGQSGGAGSGSIEVFVTGGYDGEQRETLYWQVSGAGLTQPYANHQQDSFGNALLGAGIGSLAGLFAQGNLSGAYNGALAGMTLSMMNSNSPYVGGGLTYGIGGAVNPWSGWSGQYGQYPGYGFPGISGQNIYGGYYGNSGYGYGSPGYSSYNWNTQPTSWNSGFTSNPYYQSGTNTNYQQPANYYGSTGYYSGWGRNSTEYSPYYYRSLDTSYGLALTHGGISESESTTEVGK